MGSKPPSKSGEPPTKKPSGKKANPLSQAEQSERFKETARDIGVDESGKDFERLFRRLMDQRTK